MSEFLFGPFVILKTTVSDICNLRVSTRGFLGVVLCACFFLSAACYGADSTLALSSGSGAPGTTVALPLSFTSGTGTTAGLEWALNLPASASLLSVQVGPAATAAGKSLYCNGNLCLITGLNANTIGNGVVATVAVTVASTAAGDSVIQLANTVEALADGTPGVVVSTSATLTASSVVAVRLNPISVGLSPNQTMPFTASVTGTSNTAVIWSLNTAIGTVDTLGLYTAPPSIPFNETVTVVATSVADPTKSASATVTLQAPPTVVTINPTMTTLSANQATQFSATVTGPSNTAVTWSVNPAIGTLNASGLYTAPTAVASNQTLIVVATSVSDPTKFASATVSLQPPPPVVNLNPTSTTLVASQTTQFTATVTGTSNTAVTWSLNPAIGTLSASGLYAAPASIASPQTVTVLATSVADPTKSASATVMLQPPAGQVTINPTSKTLFASQTNQFTANVSGVNNTAVTWSLNPAVGTLTSSGLFTAPAAIPYSQAVIVTATSLANSSKSASATVTLKPASLSINPTATTLSAMQTAQFSAKVSGASTTAVIWSLNPTVGTLSSSGLFTAPVAIPSTETVIVTAMSVADPTKSASATVTLEPAAISINPTSTTLSASQTAQFGAKVTGANTAVVTWSLNPAVGALSSSGLFTAPASIASSSTVIVTATSVADPTKSASAAVTLKPAAISISPTSTTLLANQSAQFSAKVTGASTEAVTWSLNPSVGTLSSSGRYTSPASIASDQTVTVIATSVADPTKSASSPIKLQAKQ